VDDRRHSGNVEITVPGGIAGSLLQEVAERLADLAAGGEGTAIDLLSLPMTRTDRDEIEKRLGRGEVAATLDVAGKSEVWETAYAGVWWVRHFGAGERIAAERIEIARIPEILATHTSDIQAASEKLLKDLAHGWQPSFDEETEHA